MNLGQYIDHTLLKPDATKEQIKTICNEAVENNFKAVCINSTHIPYVNSILNKSDVNICTVVGFPLGASPSEVKSLEAKIAIDHGADEIDMVINIGALKDKQDELVLRDIKSVVKTVHDNKKILKVIIETCLLNEDEKIRACKLCVDAGVDFVKTSTGFAGGGATLEDVALMRKTVGPDMGVKASGGVRDIEMAQKMIEAGATRIGTSSGVKIVNGEQATGY